MAEISRVSAVTHWPTSGASTMATTLTGVFKRTLEAPNVDRSSARTPATGQRS